MSAAMTSNVLVATREAWHRLAEHVLAPARYAVDGHISLQVAPGGFGTPEVGTSATRVAVDGEQLVVVRDGREVRSVPRTLREAADLVGIEPGAPVGVYPPATPCHPDEPLAIDPAAARELADWYRLGAEALADLAPDEPARLWPEHFDLGISVDRVNYGVSPGDAVIGEPYAYAGPWDALDDPDGFFDRSFGAARTRREVRSVTDLAAFFRTARDHSRRTP
jgi:hypothetical protein